MVIAILGQGTIGSGVLELANGTEDFRVKRILEKRFHNELTTENIEDITGDPEIEAVVETMGGLHPAYEFAAAVLRAGKHFVTANKLLVSTYGMELTALAKQSGAAFLYSAACGGGIAYLANLKIAASVDRITALGGILNGTTNFILDSMTREGGTYAAALATAQALGYAERDPSSDVDGLDTMRKLILACAVGFDAFLSTDDVPTFGISGVLPQDVEYAKKNGCALRLCATGERTDGGVCGYVEPTLMAADSPEAAILKNVNYAWYCGDAFGLMSYIGQGAGKLPTAANVMRDLRGISAGCRYMTGEACAAAKNAPEAARHAYYVRVPLDADFPAEWIARRTQDDAFAYIETVPVSVSSMHDYAKENRAFIAGFRKG